MRKFSLNYHLVVFLALFSIVLFFNTCSDDVSFDVCDSFLECNDALKWKYAEFEGGIEVVTLFFKLNDDEDNPFEIWFKDYSNDCCYHASSCNICSSFLIIENSRKRFVVKLINGPDRFVIWNITKQEGFLKLVIDVMENDVQQEKTLFLNSTSENLDNLNICDE